MYVILLLKLFKLLATTHHLVWHFIKHKNFAGITSWNIYEFERNKIIQKKFPLKIHRIIQKY